MTKKQIFIKTQTVTLQDFFNFFIYISWFLNYGAKGSIIRENFLTYDGTLEVGNMS